MRKKKHRKQYALLIDPVKFALQGAALIDQKSLDKLRQGELVAIESFRSGHAEVADWILISEICNLTESMAKDGIGPEALEAVKRAEDALIDAHGRYVRTGKMGTTGQGLTAFRDVYEYHDLQRQSVPRSVYERHINRVMNKIRSKSSDIIFMSKKGESNE